jgi:LmbE family N-acetylglucosaminyl deacetylase
VVGVTTVEFLGHADGLVVEGLDLRRDIAGAIRRHRPDVVITMNFELTWDGVSVNHADHRAVGRATLDACRDAANRWLHPELGEPWQGVDAVYVNATSTTTHHVDVSATIERGVASLLEHRAYLDGLGGDFDPDAFLRESGAALGQEVGCSYAVGFQRFAV